MVIFTPEYLAAAPHADVVITYPDGAVRETRLLSDGNGCAVAAIRDAIAFERASSVARCSEHFDRVRRSHAEAYAREGRAGSAWAAPRGAHS